MLFTFPTKNHVHVSSLFMLAWGNPLQIDKVEASIHQKCHDDLIKWKHLTRYLPLVRGIHRWIPRTKASGAEPWCFPWCVPGPTTELTMYMPVNWTPSRSLWHHFNMIVFFHTDLLCYTLKYWYPVVLIRYCICLVPFVWFHLLTWCNFNPSMDK